MKPIDTINVIPFIDVMLVLLAMVLATATFIVEGRLEVALPEAVASAAETATAPFDITVDAGGAVFAAGEPVDLAGLGERLDRLTPATPIRLRVDRAAAFGGFVGVVDLLRARGLERVSISTRRP